MTLKEYVGNVGYVKMYVQQVQYQMEQLMKLNVHSALNVLKNVRAMQYLLMTLKLKGILTPKKQKAALFHV